jgi:hypothetical protein
MDRKKVFAVINWSILFLVVLVAAWTVWNVYTDGDDIAYDPLEGILNSVTCTDVSSLDGFEYDACFDAGSEAIFLKVTRQNDNFTVQSLSVSFVDIFSQSFNLDDVPSAGKNKAYKVPAKKNPNTMEIRLDVSREFGGVVCGAKEILVDYCPVGVGSEGVGVTISPLDGVGVKDFIEIEDFPEIESDIFVMDLVAKGKAWESKCKSEWSCGSWGVCDNGFQRRACEDVNDCLVSTSASPVSVRGCDGECVENWRCSWTECIDGFSTPDCEDLSSCGTTHDKPSPLPCESPGDCVPSVGCGAWSECEISYGFDDLLGKDEVVNIDGIRSRICEDANDCIAPRKEVEVCSVSVDIYTERFERCGESYIGVYDSLTEEVVSIVKEGRGRDPYLNIYFGDEDDIYCDYCYDGKMNGDEEDIDCGGSCKDCFGRRGCYRSCFYASC